MITKTEDTVSPYYALYVAETKAHNACALREQALLKDVEFAGREMERLQKQADYAHRLICDWWKPQSTSQEVHRQYALSALSNRQ